MAHPLGSDFRSQDFQANSLRIVAVGTALVQGGEFVFGHSARIEGRTAAHTATLVIYEEYRYPGWDVVGEGVACPDIHPGS